MPNSLIVERAILPRLAKIERQLKVPLRLAISQGVTPGVVMQELGTPRPPKGKEPVIGSALVHVRLNYGGDRYLFRVEVFFPRDLSPNTGFSGFYVPGAVTVAHDGYRLDIGGFTVRYNVWSFQGWI